MASKRQQRPDFLATAAKAGKQAREAFELDLQRRLNDQKRILSADDLSGEYDLARALFTTVDGKARPITRDDLAQFRYAVRALRQRHQGKQFLGGIKPRQVIDLSRPDDRERAKTEIHTAIPVQNRAGVVHFQTNSGPNSKVVRHHVYVEFMTYNAVVASPQPPEKIVKELVSGNIRFDCTCERHTFWYRFAASIGGWAYGRLEDGFPRIRNPRLYGVACKHVLRVMALILQSPTFRNYAVRMIAKGREELGAKRQVVKVAEMEKFAQQLKKESWRQRAIKTTEQKKAERMAAAQRRAQRAGTDLAKKAVERAKAKEAAKAAKDRAAALKGLEANARKLLMLGAITQQQFDQMMAAARASQ